MDKDWKLQRYARKDYTDLVEFPVEIVGRDGVVRRYTFEDSVRLYQRRITFAPIRYRDDDLAGAEVGHCRSRIEQLRRSFFHRFGWGTPDGQPAPLEVFGDIAGELAAFVCRVLRYSGRADVTVHSLDDPSGSVSMWYLVPRAAPDRAPTGLLLYVYRFDRDEPELVRDRFFASLKDLEAVPDEDWHSERLIAFHHTADCGFLLTGHRGEYEHLAQLRDEDPGDPEPTEWEDILEIVRRGDFVEATSRCRDLLARHPWHRSAYVAGAVLSAALHRDLDAEDFALLGTRYFPEDAVLHHQLGLARLRLNRPGEAAEALERAVTLGPDLASARFWLASVRVEQGAVAEARALLAARQGVRADHRRGEASLRRLEQWLQWRNLMRTGAGLSAGLGLVAVLVGGVAGTLPVVMGGAMWIAGRAVFNRQHDRLRQRQRYDELSQGLRRVHRRAKSESEPIA